MSSRHDTWIKSANLTPAIKKADRHLLRCLSELPNLAGQKFWLVGFKDNKTFQLSLKGKDFPGSVDWECIGILELYKSEYTLYKL